MKQKEKKSYKNGALIGFEPRALGTITTSYMYKLNIFVLL